MAVVALDSRLNDLVDPNVEVEQIVTGCVFTEGPLWDPRDDSLIFSDVRTGIMRRWTEGPASRSSVRRLTPASPTATPGTRTATC